MMTYQNQWNEKQNEKMLAYNTPLEQMKRYDEAGINPYLAASQIMPGNQQSQLTSAQAPAMQAAQVQPVTGMADAIQNSISNAADTMLKIAQARDINMDAELKRHAFDSDLEGRIFRNKSEEYTYKSNKLRFDTDFKMQPLDLALKNMNITQAAAQTKILNNKLNYLKFKLNLLILILASKISTLKNNLKLNLLKLFLKQI